MVKQTRNTAPWAKVTYLILAWIFVACIVVQTLLAGLAIFTNPEYWQQHMNFVHFFEFVPIAMLIISLIGRLRVGLRWHSVGLFALVFLQYATANAPNVGAIHPVLALVLFGYAILVAKAVSK